MGTATSSGIPSLRSSGQAVAGATRRASPPHRVRSLVAKGRRQRARRHQLLSSRSAVALSLPAVVIVTGSMLFAIYQVVRLSLVNEDFLTGGPATFAGIDNYKAALSSSAYLLSLERSVVFTVLSVAGQLAFAVALAVLMWSDSRLVRVCRAAVAIPWAVPPIVAAIVWRFVLLPGTSPVAAFLSALGLGRGVLASPTWSLFALIAVNIWEFTPLYFLFVSAGLRGLDASVLEAARVDGASGVRVLGSVVLPQLRRLLGTLAVFDTLSSMGIFDLIWVMTQGGPSNATQTSSLFVYQTAFQSYNFGTAASAVIITALAGIGLAAVFHKLITWGER